MNAAIPHYVVNASPSKEALLLVIRLIARPFYVVRDHERMWTPVPASFPSRQLLSEINPKIVRSLAGRLDPYPHEGVPFHRPRWSEELIVVTEGQLEILTKSPENRNDSRLSKLNEPISLKAPAAIHMDGRIQHSVCNPSSHQMVKYVVVHCVDLDAFEDTMVFWRAQESH